MRKMNIIFFQGKKENVAYYHSVTYKAYPSIPHILRIKKIREILTMCFSILYITPLLTPNWYHNNEFAYF